MNGYAPIELGLPGKPVCPDQFEENTGTLLCKGCVKAILQISVNAVYIQFGTIDIAGSSAGGLGNVKWGAEEPYTAISGSLGRRFDAIRVRNLTAGLHAQVLITAIPELA